MHDGGRFWADPVASQCVDDFGAASATRYRLRFRSDSSVSPLEAWLLVRSVPGVASIQAELTLRNPRPMSHPGGNWDLGAQGNLVIDEFSVSISAPKGREPSHFTVEFQDSASEPIHANSTVHVFQASSGGENWRSANHMDRAGSVPWEFRGYRVDADGQQSTGLRATPIVHATWGSNRLSATCRRFWQNFPSSISADADGVRLGLFPRESPGGHELQGGEQKTFEFAVELSEDSQESVLYQFLENAPPPVPARLYTDGRAWPYLLPRSGESDPRYEALVDLAIEGEDSFFAKAEKIDQYGWRNFGDIWGDHEAVYHKGDSPMISHYNNQYDCTLGFAIQWMRTGDRRWWELMVAMADHAWDIDTYHTDQDKLLYNGGLFWHTYHYADAHTATHRSYPKQLRVARPFEDGQDLDDLGETGEQLTKNYAIGGGPAASHNYNTGWMLAYYLTGKERYKEAAINAADYVMRIEDGSKTPFRWLSRGDTGYSTCSSDGYYGPGRASANSTHALLTGHELTGEREYLDRAAKLMRRTVHPNQDLGSLDLLNAELRWFYTMYLQALGRYVDYKDHLGQRDDDFRYGVASLLHYANWMAGNERPTLTEPEKLQYPTETWAAQDMRKWHVLEHASRYEADPTRRALMRERADYFFNYVCDYLTASPTKSLCRPVVLMLNFGWQREWLLAHRDETILDETIEDNFAPADQFTPQRTIAIRRAKKVVIASILLCVSVSIFAVVMWIRYNA